MARNERICCFTGHRDLPREEYATAFERLKTSIKKAIVEEGFTDFRAGGAIGFDMLAALAVLKLKEEHPFIKLHLILPHKEQDKYFEERDKRLYRYTIDNSDSVTYISERYYSGVMHQRNRALVDGSELCLAYLRRLSGGTYYTVRYARNNGVRVVNLGNG